MEMPIEVPRSPFLVSVNPLKTQNMKKINSILLIIVLLLEIQKIDGQSDIPLSIHYCTQEINASMGVGGYSELSAAIMLTEDVLKPYIGKSISSIAIGISHEGNEITAVKVFITRSLDEAPLYSQMVKDEAIHGGWNSIKLDTPFPITEDTVYIGYDLEASGYPVGITASTVTSPNGSWIKRGARWQQNSLKGNNCIKAIVDGYDIAINSLDTRGMIKAYSGYMLAGKVVNNGGMPISGFTVLYNLGEEEFACNISTVKPILPGLDYDFTHETPIIIEDKIYGMKVIVATNNSQTDVYQNNNTIETTLNGVFTDGYYKSILLEHFTTEQCINCPGGHAYLSSVVGDNRSVVWVAHHAGFGVDKYTIPANVDMANLFQINGAPMCILDREKGGGSPVYDNITLITKEIIKNRMDKFSPVQIKINSEYNQDTRELEIDVLYAFAEDLPQARLSVFLIEEGIITRGQAGFTGLYTHAPLLRHTLSSTFGEPINAVCGGKISQQYSYTIPEEWNADNVKIVAFINEHSFNRVNCNVLNVAQMKLSELQSDTHYVKVSSEITTRGSTVRTVGTGFYSGHETVNIMARAISSVETTDLMPVFKNWTVNGNIVSTSPSYAFKMQAEDVEYVAHFEAPIAININAVSEFNLYLDRIDAMLHVDGGEYTSLGIYNLSGKLLVATNNQTTIDVSHLKTGVYIVQLNNNQHVYTFKIIK